MSVNSGIVTFEGKSYRVSKENRLAAELSHQSTPDSWKAKKNVETCTAATLAPTASQSGTLFVINVSPNCTVTLPTAAAGLEYEFYVQTTMTGTLTINSSGATVDTLQGAIIQTIVNGLIANNSDVNTQAICSPAAADHQYVAGADTKGRLLGTRIKYTCPVAGKWVVSGVAITAGAAADVFT